MEWSGNQHIKTSPWSGPHGATYLDADRRAADITKMMLVVDVVAGVVVNYSRRAKSRFRSPL